MIPSSGVPLDEARDTARRLRTWVIADALPLWASAGWDGKLGGFHERLNLDGSPDAAAVRRVRVQARQIYVYAHASALGWRPDGGRMALAALDTLIGRYRSPDGAPGFVHTLRPDGSIDNALRDAYDHAFILLALAWLARASGDAQVRALIDDVLAFVDEHLAANDGSFYEGLPRSTPRRQNPHMHLFEAMLALHETIGHPQGLPRAITLRKMLDTHFIDPATDTLTEFFDDGWQRLSPQEAIEPGHHAEWSWLVARHARLSGQAVDSRARALLDIALRSIDPSIGLVPDEAGADGRPIGATHRCWPQTEFAKACLLQHAAGATDTLAPGALALRNIEQRYLSGPFAGGWIDKIRTSGEPLAEFVPASTLYHLFGVIAEADRALRDTA